MDLLVPESDAEVLKREAAQCVSWDVNERQAFDLEMLLSGAFAPLRGYLSRADCERVLAEMRLLDGSIWPLPVVLDVSEEFAARVEPGQAIALRDAEGVLLAVMQVEDKWVPDRMQDAQAIYGTTDEAHPGVHGLLRRTHPVCLGGRAARRAIARPLRLHLHAAHAARGASRIRQAWLAEGGGLPHPQSAAPAAVRNHQPRRAGGRCQPAGAAHRRAHPAGRHRLLHAAALLGGRHAALPGAPFAAVRAAAGDAARGAEGSGAPGHRGPQLRLYSRDRRTLPGGRGARRRGQVLLPPRRGEGIAAALAGRTGRQAGGGGGARVLRGSGELRRKRGRCAGANGWCRSTASRRGGACAQASSCPSGIRSPKC